jgi:hypothetical protein
LSTCVNVEVDLIPGLDGFGDGESSKNAVGRE